MQDPDALAVTGPPSGAAPLIANEPGAAEQRLGISLYSQSRFGEAADCFRRVIATDRRSARAHFHLGAALLQLGDPNAALSFLEAVRLDPRNFKAAEGLSESLADAACFERTFASVVAVQRAKPDALGLRILLGDICLLARRFDAARIEYEAVLRRQPGNLDALIGLASALTEQGFAAESGKLLEEALSRQPSNPRARSAYAALLLRSGDFARAWDYYESRSQAAFTTNPNQRGIEAPRWQGESLRGKTLLITREQGLGDELMFASIIPEMISDAARVIVECDGRLEPLFRRSFPEATVLGVDAAEASASRRLERALPSLPAIDAWTPMGTLPRFRRSTRESFQRKSGYMVADESRVEYWKHRLHALGRGPKIGLVWRGGTAVSRAAARSLRLEQLRPVLTIPGIHFVSLQHGRCHAEIGAFRSARGVSIHHWHEAIDSFDETAALVTALDRVISVCTAVVNLAGGLGCPVWVMAPFVADARYGWEGPTSVWYPSLRVFRQPRIDSWDPVIADVRAELLRSQTDEATGAANA